MSALPKFDVLAFAPHPDDVELSAGGTVASMTAGGYRVGIVDLTRGELSSRGTVEQREQEALAAARILGVDRRVNLGIADGNIRNSRKNRLKVIAEIRATRPDILLLPAPECRHPDHPAGARLVADAAFQAGLVKIETSDA
ncbi:MAG: PIG-L family deacetylase, partial [Bacteroidetes bacterium]|nr:PIG-L family deacetylase [Bacteroidota bacterium]